MKKKFFELKEGEIFTLELGADKMYRLTKVFVDGDKTYYLTQRAYGNGGSGFWSTNSNKEVFVTPQNT